MAFYGCLSRLTRHSLPGLSVQPVDRSFDALLHDPVPIHNLCLVGSPTGVDIRLATGNAFSRFRILRLRILLPHDRKPARHLAVLRSPFTSNESLYSSDCSHVAD